MLAIPMAMLAGLVSFVSPCVLPLVPGYIGYVSGLADGSSATSRRRVVIGVLLFILGFSVVFVTYGAAFGAIGAWLTQWQDTIVRILGLVVIAMGLALVGQFTFLQRTIKPKWLPAAGLGGAPVLGVVFGLGWTPCIGPTLSAVVALSLTGGDATRGAVLGFAYCLGIGIPFLLIALGGTWATKAIGVVRRHIRAINLIGGGVLVVLGILMTLGIWGAWILSMQGLIGSFVTPI